MGGSSSARAILACGLACLAACSTESAAVVLDLVPPPGATTIRIHAKRYLEGSEVRLFQPRVVGLEPGAERLSLGVELPAEGRYAIHVVASGEGGEVYAATRCTEVEGSVLEADVGLLQITTDLDADGDTFAESRAALCSAMGAVGLQCDERCAAAEYLALTDCNPTTLPEGPTCPAELPASESFHPFAPDLCEDCLDQDCYGGDAPCEDRDGDGVPGGTDCDDDDPQINPLAEEVCGNGVDENCRVDDPGCLDGDVPCDEDGDGFAERVSLSCGQDCDDGDPSTYPGAVEVCDDGLDNDCNGRVDEGCFPDDVDDDGVPAPEDCNDCDPAVHPGAAEICGNGVDDDCDGEDEPCDANDQDGDSYAAPPAGADCDDGDPRIYPGAPDPCGDGVAQSCAADPACEEIVDEDGDGYSADDEALCDGDDDPGVSPAAAEVCDGAGTDEDCDGLVNEVLDPAGLRGCGFDGASGTWYAIDFDGSVDHCGGCRQPCEAPPDRRTGTSCVGGECDCDGIGPCGDGPESYCCPSEEGGAACRDIRSDRRNCGACGRQCVPGEDCVQPEPGRAGQCSCPWEPGDAACGSGSCVECCFDLGCRDLCADPTSCGECGLACNEGDRPRGDRCLDGECVCGPTGEICGEWESCTYVADPSGGCGCANLRRDEANCGACGVACDSGEECIDGRCLCPPTGAECDDTCCPGVGCVNTSRDPRACGSCATPCAWGEDCRGNQCRCGSTRCDASTQDCCGDTCFDVLSDPTHCGPLGTGDGCTASCGSGFDCVGGACSCPGVECGGTCYDPGECCADADCDDGDPCTLDSCNVGTHTCLRASATCVAGATDGCCPASCTAVTDRDCCDAASCDLVTSDACCPAGCTVADDADCT